MKVTKTQITVTITKGYAWSLTKDLLVIKGLSALRSIRERYPSSRGDHHHAARLLSRDSSKKALDCHIYGI